ncbi:hypothetical protein [Nocardia sp.]|uniref:hypothetical protein n=1 Tax=Nocardia sp. TaxID=1821 RepID=UPI002614341F|nr:hypothetical protein [Nocardia sp.]
MADLAVDRLIPAPSQWPEFYSWAHDAFAITDDSWDPAGGTERWNGSKPYGKMIHAIYLLAYALRDVYLPQWHARADYLAAARAIDNQYHGPFYLRFRNSSDHEATSETGLFATRDRTNYKCPVFDLGGPSDDPSNRASVLVHESWHHWQRKYHWKTDHQHGGAVAPGLDGDWYYFHGSGLFDFGTLWTSNPHSNPLRFHSPYQVQIEFDADLAEFSFSWVPVIVQSQARYYGNTRLTNQCKNRITYRIGDPRPF